MLSKILLKLYSVIRFSGIVALVGGIVGSTVAYLRHPSLEEYWPVISNLGAYVSSAIWFNTTAVFVGIFLLSFWLGYSEHKGYSKFEQLISTLPAIGVVGVGLFPANYGNCIFCLQRILHWAVTIAIA